MVNDITVAVRYNISFSLNTQHDECVTTYKNPNPLLSEWSHFQATLFKKAFNLLPRVFIA